MVASRLGLVINAKVFEDLDNCQRCARQHALLRLLVVYVADVTVQVATVELAQSFHVLLNADAVAQKIVHGATEEAREGAEARVVHENTVHIRVFVGLLQSLQQLVLGHFAQLVADAVACTGLARPLGVLLGP